MNVSGSWINVYGSVIWLEQKSAGNVFGVYESHTGSTGAYWVAGFTDPNFSRVDEGQCLALSIFWRSFLAGKTDPSWHYVSSFSGQMITLNDKPTLTLMHDLVATTPFPGVVPAPASYLDKLLYTPNPASPAPAQWPSVFQPPQSVQPVNGTWVCSSQPGVSMTLTVQDEIIGYLTGILQIQGHTVPMIGFTDVYAQEDGLLLQGLTLSALLPGGGSVVGLAGSLNLQSAVLSIAWLQSQGTAADSTWLQTTLQATEFTLVAGA